MHCDVVVDPDHKAFGGVRLAVFADDGCSRWSYADTGGREMQSHYFADNGGCEWQGVGQFGVFFETL